MKSQSVMRYDIEGGNLVQRTDGFLADYAGMLHFLKEALEHGLTLSEAIDACELENGK